MGHRIARDTRHSTSSGGSGQMVGKPSLIDKVRLARHSGTIARNARNSHIFVRGSSNEGLTLTCMLRSFVPQGNHGIDFHRPSRGDIAGEQCDGAQQERDACIRQRVRRAHAEKLAG